MININEIDNTMPLGVSLFPSISDRAQINKIKESLVAKNEKRI